MSKIVKNSNPVGNHFVPQCYLNNFANDDKQLLVHDKSTDKGFVLNVSNVAKKRDFYYTKNDKDNYYWEKFFANNVEPLYSILLNEIIYKVTLKPVIKPLDYKFKYEFAKMIVYQMLRVPPRINYGIDNYYSNLHHSFYDFVSQYESVFGKENIDKIKDKISDELVIKDILLSVISDSKRVNKFANVLLNKTWVIFYNTSNEPFLTSDNPVTMYNFIEKGTSTTYCGIGRKDTIITFPINSRILIMLAPKEMYFGRFDLLYNGKIIYTNENNFISFWNKQQFYNSTRQLYFPRNFFK